MYASAYRNFIPIGWLSQDSYSPGTSTIWYMHKTRRQNGPSGLGYLYAANVVNSDPKSLSSRTVWYCPNMPTAFDRQ